MVVSVWAVDDKFFNAIHQLETGGKVGNIVGDHGRALGPLQIHRNYFKDAASKDKTLGKNNYRKVTDLAFSKRVVSAYLKRHAPEAYRKKDYQTLARVHNGGPDGMNNPRTLSYWKRLKNLM